MQLFDSHVGQDVSCLTDSLPTQASTLTSEAWMQLIKKMWPHDLNLVNVDISKTLQASFLTLNRSLNSNKRPGISLKVTSSH